ncbi:MAG: hypothetical protein HY741_09820 [Chloroflexi bacterium]|nr:hypothetical protein [Chloroflexota bacterium]
MEAIAFLSGIILLSSIGGIALLLYLVLQALYQAPLYLFCQDAGFVESDAPF